MHRKSGIDFAPEIDYYTNNQINKNFNPNNIRNILNELSNYYPRIQHAINHGILRVDRNIHKSQMSGSPHFWLRIEIRDIYMNLEPNGVLHIFLCFRPWTKPIYGGINQNNCIIPPVIKGTDYPDVKQLLINGGNWVYINLTGNPTEGNIPIDPNYIAATRQELENMKSKLSKKVDDKDVNIRDTFKAQIRAMAMKKSKNN